MLHLCGKIIFLIQRSHDPTRFRNLDGSSILRSSLMGGPCGEPMVTDGLINVTLTELHPDRPRPLHYVFGSFRIRSSIGLCLFIHTRSCQLSINWQICLFVSLFCLPVSNKQAAANWPCNYTYTIIYMCHRLGANTF